MGIRIAVEGPTAAGKTHLIEKVLFPALMAEGYSIKVNDSAALFGGNGIKVHIMERNTVFDGERG